MRFCGGPTANITTAATATCVAAGYLAACVDAAVPLQPF
jgi:hypothetical protein